MSKIHTTKILADLATDLDDPSQSAPIAEGHEMLAADSRAQLFAAKVQHKFPAGLSTLKEMRGDKLVFAVTIPRVYEVVEDGGAIEIDPVSGSAIENTRA